MRIGHRQVRARSRDIQDAGFGEIAVEPCRFRVYDLLEPSTHSRFMRMSTLLINHHLRPDIGARIVAAAADRYQDLPGVLDSIIAIADRKHAAVVEDFFGDIPDGNLKDFAYWVILAWYSGCSSEKADATVFTYEDALTFKTTADVVAIPSYCFSGSDGWSQITVPLANMPKF
jgi:fructose 5-dehydrogenase small subunit